MGSGDSSPAEVPNLTKSATRSNQAAWLACCLDTVSAVVSSKRSLSPGRIWPNFQWSGLATGNQIALGGLLHQKVEYTDL